jgi:pimeloyl-ACP methyl ester carboxylesterase
MGFMRQSILLILLCYSPRAVTGQEAVYFYAGDGLKVRADLYMQNHQQPFIILCHQDGSNRSEYYEIAPRLLNLNYNCLAVDLRAGGNSGFVQNETASRALMDKKGTRPIDAAADISAAIRYVQGISKQPVILLGSYYSASLCLLTAADNPLVKAVIALSPGEYFQPQVSVEEAVQKITQQVFVSATQTEYPYLQKMLADLPVDRLTLFKPEKGTALQGTRAFGSSNASSGEYWFALMMFFKKLG